MRIMLAAMCNGRVIGNRNRLPWQNDTAAKAFREEDMRIFRERTTGHVLIQGRATYESVPDKFRPLPGRYNIVVTRSADYAQEGVAVCCSPQEVAICNAFGHKAIIVVASLGQALSIADEAEKQLGTNTFIIGGEQIYVQTMREVDQIVLTVLRYQSDGDAHFPPIPDDLFEMPAPPMSMSFGTVPRYHAEIQTWERRLTCLRSTAPRPEPVFGQPPLAPMPLAVAAG